MSTDVAAAAGGASGAGDAAVAEPIRVPGSARSWLRLLGSELRLIFRRWRNLALIGVLVVIPVILGIGLKVSTPHGGGGGGPAASFIAQLAGNGVFLAFLALTIMLTLVLPLVVAVVSGDSIAGESGHGTLRYLLTVPAGRTRLLIVKYTAVVIFGLVSCLVVAVVSLIMGLILFPVGPVTLLSGTTVSLADGLLRLLYVTLFLAAAMAALGAIGLAISTLTEHAIGAIAAILVLTVASEVADNVSQFAAIHPYLPTHFWLSFDSLLRSPITTGDLLHSLLSFAVYIVIFGTIAWARFTSADVTS
jgi:ABC-2 type transport system permease protein